MADVSTPPPSYTGLLGVTWRLLPDGVSVEQSGNSGVIRYGSITGVEVNRLNLLTRGHIRLEVNGARSSQLASADPYAILTPGAPLRFGPVNAQLEAFAAELQSRVAAASGREAAVEASAPVHADASGNASAGRPKGNALAPYRPPGDLWPVCQVVGESRYTSAISGVLGRIGLGQQRETEVEAVLVPEPHNRYDPNAVAVQIGGATVGYLPREDALAWKPALDRLAASNAAMTPRARVWGMNRSAADGGFWGSVSLALSEPTMTLPLNSPPAGQYSILPWGAKLKLGGASDAAVLGRYAAIQQHGLLLVTLTLRTETPARGAERTIVDAHVDGALVGSLGATSSLKVAPLVQHLNAKGLDAAAWATLQGSSLASELSLQPARASDVPETWLQGEAVTVPPLVSP